MKQYAFKIWNVDTGVVYDRAVRNESNLHQYQNADKNEARVG